jgi:hypothetical protein
MNALNFLDKSREFKVNEINLNFEFNLKYKMV